VENTKINWADSTFNPWIGCTKVSSGCDHCYAERQDSRKLHGNEIHWGNGAPRRITSAAYWKQPLIWERQAMRDGQRRRVFCASMADWADREAPGEARNQLLRTIKNTPHLDWLVLTKRPVNIRRYLPPDWGAGYPNVWMGVTVENKKQGLPRIEILRTIPAAVRFISFEPLLEDLGKFDLTGIHWAIIGGETGISARSMDLQWARSIITQCKSNKVAVWVKQLGRTPVDRGKELLIYKTSRKRDSRGEDISLWPSGANTLRIRRHPKSMG
jgi:protein gp37